MYSNDESADYGGDALQVVTALATTTSYIHDTDDEMDVDRVGEEDIPVQSILSRLWYGKNYTHIPSTTTNQGGGKKGNSTNFLINLASINATRCTKCNGCIHTNTCIELNKTPCPGCKENKTIKLPCYHLQLCEIWTTEQINEYKTNLAFHIEFFKGTCNHPIYLTYLQNKKDQTPPSFSLPLLPLINTINEIQPTMGATPITTGGATTLVNSTIEQNIFDITTTPPQFTTAPPRTVPDPTTTLLRQIEDARILHERNMKQLQDKIEPVRNEQHTVESTTTHNSNTRSEVRELVSLLTTLFTTPNTNSNVQFKAPNMSLSKIDHNGETISGTKYHLWKKRFNQQIVTFGLEPEQVYNMLIDNSLNLIPHDWREEIKFCTTLNDIFTTLDNLNEAIELTLPTLLRNLLNIPMAPEGTQFVIERTSHLLKSLDELHSLHPHHKLQYHEVLKILHNLNCPSVKNIIYELVTQWQTNQQSVTLENSLHKYLQTLRKSSIDLLAALKRSGTRIPQNTQLGITSGHPKSPQNYSPHTPKTEFKGGHYNRKLQKHIAGHCGVCESEHMENFSNCPELEEIKTGRKELPNSLCSKCIKPKLSSNEQHINCNIYTFKNTGKTVNCLCSIHKYTHYKICRKCPVNEYNPTQS